MGFFDGQKKEKSSGSRVADANSLWDSFFRHVMKKEFAPALTALSGIERLEPLNPQVFLKRGEILKRNGDNKGAVMAYLKAVDVLPKGEYGQKAKAIFNIVLRIDPDNPHAKSGLKTFNETSRVARASSSADSALELGGIEIPDAPAGPVETGPVEEDTPGSHGDTAPEEPSYGEEPPGPEHMASVPSGADEGAGVQAVGNAPFELEGSAVQDSGPAGYGSGLDGIELEGSAGDAFTGSGQDEPSGYADGLGAGTAVLEGITQSPAPGAVPEDLSTTSAEAAPATGSLDFQEAAGGGASQATGSLDFQEAAGGGASQATGSLDFEEPAGVVASGGGSIGGDEPLGVSASSGKSLDDLWGDSPMAPSHEESPEDTGLAAGDEASVGGGRIAPIDSSLWGDDGAGIAADSSDITIEPQVVTEGPQVETETAGSESAGLEQSLPEAGAYEEGGIELGSFEEEGGIDIASSDGPYAAVTEEPAELLDITGYDDQSSELADQSLKPLEEEIPSIDSTILEPAAPSLAGGAVGAADLAERDFEADAMALGALAIAGSDMTDIEEDEPLPPIFSFLSVEDIESLPEKAAHLSFNDGDTVILEGDSSDSMFIIESGRARVETSLKGRTVLLGMLEQGAFFGEVAFLTGKPRTASVLAEGSLEVMEINRELLQNTIDNNPLVFDRLLDMYKTRARDAINKLKNVQ